MPLRFSPARGASVLISSSSRGPQGAAATIEVGDVTTIAPGATPGVVNSGSTAAAVLDFSLPATPVLSVGTVTTLPAGQNATVGFGGTPYNITINFGIPQGLAGTVGIQGTPTVNQFATWFNASTVQGVSITGLVKGNGASAPTAAVASTDYAPATSGSAILKGNGSGGFSSAVAGTDYLAPAAIGVTVQAYDADLTTWAGLTPSANAQSLVTAANYAAMRTLLGLVIGTDVLAYDAQLSSLVRQNSQSAAYTTVAADSGKHILHPAADNNARTFTIAANASVAYTIGTVITFVNEINTVTVAINSDTLTLAGAGTTGSRTLAANGIATAIKVTSTKWVISGTGLT